MSLLQSYFVYIHEDVRAVAIVTVVFSNCICLSHGNGSGEGLSRIIVGWVKDL